MAKKFTTSALNNLGKKYNEKKKIYILDGEYEVDINLNFRPSEIDDLMLVYTAAITELKELANVSDIQIKDTVSLLPTLILRSFSNLPIPKKNKDIASLIILSKNLYDEGIIEEVYPHYPLEQIKKIEDKITAFGKNIGTVMGEWAIQSALQESKDSEENEDVNDMEQGEENAEFQQPE